MKEKHKTFLAFSVAALFIILGVRMWTNSLSEIHPAADGEAVYIETVGFTINDSLSDQEAREVLEHMLRMRAQK